MVPPTEYIFYSTPSRHTKNQVRAHKSNKSPGVWRPCDTQSLLWADKGRLALCQEDTPSALPSTGGHFQREAALAKREKTTAERWRKKKRIHDEGADGRSARRSAEHKATPPSVGASDRLDADAAEADAAEADAAAATSFSGSSAGSTEVVRVPEKTVISNFLCLQLAYGRPAHEVRARPGCRFLCLCKKKHANVAKTVPNEHTK